MEMEFEKVWDLMPIVNINITATNEHVTEVQSKTQIIKERCRGVLSTLLFTNLPQKLIIGLVQFITMWLNTFPNNTGISSKWIP